jgi:hypothetical protein
MANRILRKPVSEILGSPHSGKDPAIFYPSGQPSLWMTVTWEVSESKPIGFESSENVWEIMLME